MTTQETLSFAPSIADRFNDFDNNNPHVWQLFKQFARDAYQAGHARFSAQSIIERIRWKTSVETRGGEFKINNDFAAFYARKFHHEFPHLDGFFRTRNSVADRFDTYPRSFACAAIAWLFTIGTIGAIGLLVLGV